MSCQTESLALSARSQPTLDQTFFVSDASDELNRTSMSSTNLGTQTMSNLSLSNMLGLGETVQPDSWLRLTARGSVRISLETILERLAEDEATRDEVDETDCEQTLHQTLHEMRHGALSSLSEVGQMALLTGPLVEYDDDASSTMSVPVSNFQSPGETPRGFEATDRVSSASQALRLRLERALQLTEQESSVGLFDSIESASQLCPDTARSTVSVETARDEVASDTTGLEDTTSVWGGLGDTMQAWGLNRSTESQALAASLELSIQRILQLGMILTGQRLSDREIQALPKVRFEEKEQQQCTICLEGFQKGEMLTALSCKHYFHIDCVASWLQRATHCPLCRAPCNEMLEDWGSSTARIL
eukprot:gnl/MRDRNA2_/MRDRNA2_157620_c0_seq1.p1 gnl/MRDRNA2_/MRDRNA2_157620_c0~~gnl/MRDRNA2_/MRDRNA2_157620_c0_seq1.p1  ORF type:complete len:415 (-),score=74.19 gnl/MRDRNA2_/MRDRNA2_157620_c0_seq1:217-1296(-)